MRIEKRNTSKVGSLPVAAAADQSSYEGAIESIKQAISSLGSLAKNKDKVAADAIANLSVILFDLKN